MKVTVIVWVAAVFFIGWMVYFGMRDAMPGWSVIAAGLLIAFCAALTWRAYLPLAEERLAAELLASGDARAVSARITDVARRGTRETEDRRETQLALTLMLTESDRAVGAEAARSHCIVIAVEDALLADFATGKHIHLLQDAQRPDRVALDRRRTTTQVQ